MRVLRLFLKFLRLHHILFRILYINCVFVVVSKIRHSFLIIGIFPYVFRRPSMVCGPQQMCLVYREKDLTLSYIAKQDSRVVCVVCAVCADGEVVLVTVV